MKLVEIIKRINECATYNDMTKDIDEAIAYAVLLTEAFTSNDPGKIHELAIQPLMILYREAEDQGEIEYINETMQIINEYLLKKGE